MENARFATTQWSVVLAAADPASPSSGDALAELCAAYWYPLYAFVRRQGKSAVEAEDLTQAFFARVLEKKYLRDVSPEKGRFRTFLLVCLKRFLVNEWERERALKRGAGVAAVSIDFADADGRYKLEPADLETPDRVFERRWALTVLERALDALVKEMHDAGKGRLMDHLKVYLAAEAAAPPHAETARQLGMSEGAVKVAVHRLRERYRQLLRREIASTLSDPTDVEDEIRRLFDALARG